MTKREPQPGVSRDDRISDEGLRRLEQQLQSGRQISDFVLKQWVKRYPNTAADIIRQYRPGFKAD